MTKRERRNNERRSRHFSFQYNGLGVDELPFSESGELIDYSLAGMRFSTEKKLEKNANLVIELEFRQFGEESKAWRDLWEEGEAETLKVIGAVMWCQKDAKKPELFEVGTRFIGKAR